MQLDFLQYQASLRISQQADEAMFVFDPIRKKNVVLTPEELLRQLVLQYLLQHKQYLPGKIRSEIGITVNGMPRRCDILVFDGNLQPWLLVECKSPKIALTQAVVEQAVRYNMTLNVPYLAVTNGLLTFCFRLDHAAHSWELLPDFPDFGA